MDFWTSLAAAADRHDVLRHPFYQRWTAGELGNAELALYAGQYAHAVEALAAASTRAAELSDGEAAAGLEQHAGEEIAHVELWRQFADCVGARDASPLPETEDCAAAWAGAQRPLLPTLVALYALESAQPAIAKTKLEGLLTHYAVPEGPATEYFALHAERDVEHARDARVLIESALARGASTDGLLESAETVLAANWRLLDGVQRACGH